MIYKKKKDKKESDTLRWMRETREEEYEVIRKKEKAEEAGFRKLEKK